VRSPLHPVALALLYEFKAGKSGIAAPSANKFGHVSFTSAQQCDEFHQDAIALANCIPDGGQSEVDIASQS
jgi:L-threonylcarbamoyladenylate synthase